MRHSARGTRAAEWAVVIPNRKIASILLVDDDVELLKALAKVLEKEGYEVGAYPDARLAIQFINETKKRFDLVITDVSMPGMKGTTFLAAVKTAFPSVPVIIITAFGDWGQYMEALREGAYEYLSKPLDKADLLAAVARALKNGKQAANA
jgi:DNA-binding NtrC family response regulator